MRIGAIVHMYPPLHNAGAEHMLHAMLSGAVKRGHSCTVVVDHGPYGAATFKPYVLDGVKVSSDKRALGKCEVLVTHLDRTEDAEQMATRRNIPLVQVIHNHSRVDMMKKCDLAVYNTEWLIKGFPCPYRSMVLHPPVYPERYKVERRGEAITLINLTKPKGVDMFYRLAQDMPDLPFLGVKGSYGVQLAPPRPLKNLTIIDNQTDIRVAYAQTKILLMPSSYESYGRCAIEAAVSGIPTIAHHTPGLREALGEYGTFPVEDSDSWRCAVRFVLEQYELKSNAAKALARTLDPERDIDRWLAEMQDVVDQYAKM